MGFEYNFRERKKQNSENSSDSSVSKEIHSTYALNITLSTKNTFQKRKGTKIREFILLKNCIAKWDEEIIILNYTFIKEFYCKAKESTTKN